MSGVRSFLGWLLLLLLASSPAQAGLTLALAAQDLDPAQREASHLLMQEAMSMLPPLLVERMDRQVPVRWHTGLPDAVFGRATPGGTLQLNRRWLQPLVDGSQGDYPADRLHGSVRRELLATLIHEIAHLYDRGRFWPQGERALLRQCRRRQETQGMPGMPSDCRGQTERLYTLSDHPRFLDLAGWPQQVGRHGAREQTNRQTWRSPDRYELHSPGEYMAVNLEYFLLDPQFPCRRPMLHAFLAEHFNWAPSSAECHGQLPYLHAGLDKHRSALGWLDPERIYAVHYLLAEPNDQWVSRWGHSMLRLVICAPGRAPGPECLLDLDHHLVLSFRAFVDDLQLSSLDGLVGNYPSRLFMLPLQRVIDEYTKLELRGLRSVPLKLDAQAREGLALQAAGLHWSYDGTYYFISNNCAVETLKLLRSGTALRPLQDLDSLTPTGLLELLLARGIADDTPLRDRDSALRQGYYFNSYRENYEVVFGVLRERLGLPMTSLTDWLRSPAVERQTWIEAADIRAAAAMLVLEEAIRRRLVVEIQQDLKQRVHAPGAPQELSEAAELMQSLLSGSSFLSRPGELMSGGYGLPQLRESREFIQQAEARHQSLLAGAEQLEGQLPALMDSQLLGEMNATADNIARLGAHMRRWHRESGGIQLP